MERISFSPHIRVFRNVLIFSSKMRWIWRYVRVWKFKLRVGKDKQRVGKEQIWVFGDRVKFSSVKSEASFPALIEGDPQWIPAGV